MLVRARARARGSAGRIVASSRTCARPSGCSHASSAWRLARTPRTSTQHYGHASSSACCYAPVPARQRARCSHGRPSAEADGHPPLFRGSRHRLCRRAGAPAVRARPQLPWRVRCGRPGRVTAAGTRWQTPHTTLHRCLPRPRALRGAPARAGRFRRRCTGARADSRGVPRALRAVCTKTHAAFLAACAH